MSVDENRKLTLHRVVVAGDRPGAGPAGRGAAATRGATIAVAPVERRPGFSHGNPGDSTYRPPVSVARTAL